MTDVQIKEMMQGTVLLIEDVAVASKLGAGNGWKVKSLTGRPFPSVRWRATPGDMTNVKQVKDKATARKELLALADKADQPSKTLKMKGALAGESK